MLSDEKEERRQKSWENAECHPRGESSRWIDLALQISSKFLTRFRFSSKDKDNLFYAVHHPKGVILSNSLSEPVVKA